MKLWRTRLSQQKLEPSAFFVAIGILRLRSCFATRSSHSAQDDTDNHAESDTILIVQRRSVTEYLANFLRRGAECAYVQHWGYRTVRWSYRQVAETAFQFARELEARAIGKGDRVLLWGPNSAEWVAAFFGCALRGAIIVPVDEAGTLDFMQRVLRQVEGKLLLCSREHVQSLKSVPTPVLILDALHEAVSRHSSLSTIRRRSILRTR